MKVKLTKATIEAAIRKKQRACLWDTATKGLYAEIQINQTSTSCSYRFRYHAHRKKYTITLGAFEDMSLEQARTKAGEIQIQVHQGNAPQATRNTITFAQLIQEKYLPLIKTSKKA